MQVAEMICKLEFGVTKPSLFRRDSPFFVAKFPIVPLGLQSQNFSSSIQ